MANKQIRSEAVREMSVPPDGPMPRSNPRRWPWYAVGLLVSIGVCFWMLRVPTSAPVPTLPDLPDLSGKNAILKNLLLEADSEARRTGTAAAVGKLARCYHANLFFREAAACYALAELKAPTDASWPYLHAVALQSLGVSEGVPELLHRVISLESNNIPALLRLAELELKLERHADARGHFERVLALSKDNAFAHLGLARLAMATNEWQAARQHLEQAKRLDPHVRLTLRLLTAVYQQLGETELAAKAAAQADMRGRPRDFDDPQVEALNDLCYDVPYLLAMEVTRATHPLHGGNWRLDLLKRVVQCAPDNAEAHLYLGQALFNPNTIDEAGVHFREAARLDPRMEETRCNLAAWLAMKGRRDEAEAELQAALDINPQSNRAPVMLAMVRLDQGRHADAAELFRQGMDNADIISLPTVKLYVDTLVYLGRRDEAIDYLRRRIESRPAAGGFWAFLSEMYVQQGDWQQAEKVLRDGLAAAPYNSIITERLAWLLATSPHATQETGQEALKWAEISAETGDLDDRSAQPAIVLAAVYARLGRYDEAVDAAQRAMAIAQATGDQGAMYSLGIHLQKYTVRQPYTSSTTQRAE